MALKNQNFKYSYRSNKDNIYDEFYTPCILNSNKYYRATGYFTSSSLVLLAKGLEKFIFEGGKIRIVASPMLTEKDLEAIKLGEQNKINQLIEKTILEELNPTKEMIEYDTLNILAWLIEKGILEIKIAFTKDLSGIYHEKFGIFMDSETKVAFIGSANETVGGLKNNFESIEVFIKNDNQNDKDSLRVEEKLNNFEELWDNKTKNLEIMDIPKIALDKIKVYKAEYPKKIKTEQDEKEEIKNNLKTFELPPSLKIRPYQEEALISWKEAKGKGILEMATGTGKTITALYILSHLYSKVKVQKKQIVNIVVCPLKHLVNQWSEEFEMFNANSIKCFSDNKNWREDLKRKIELYNFKIIDNINIVVSQDTFCTSSFIEIINRLKDGTNKLLVIDECHNIGTFNFKKQLEKMKSFNFKLGLSATPDREDLGDGIIFEILGAVVFKFTMKEAIEQGFLCRYYYYPILVELTEEERNKYYELTDRIKKISWRADNLNSDEEEMLKILLIKRSRIIQLAENKIMKLKKLLENDNRKNNLIYVGAGKSDNGSKVEQEKEILKITRMLGFDLGKKVAKFTSEENEQTRNEIIDSFKSEEIDTIVAIKCLDEGVNIPSIQNAYILGSTTNKREYIQRRGRILRLYKDKEYAYIYDFIVVPIHYDLVGTLPSDIFNMERNLLEKELKRVNEYSSLCENKYSSLKELHKYKKNFNLLDL